MLLVPPVVPSYLLEKSRVVHQQEGERNYHIFYQLCMSDEGYKYDLEDASAYAFLNKGQCTHVRMA